MQNQLEFNWSPYYEDIGIFGKKGEGKTSRAKQILDLIPNTPRWIWSPQRPLENYSGYGTPVTEIDDLQHGGFLFAGDYTRANFIKFCNRAFHYMRNIVLVIDDVHEQVSKQFIAPEFESLILSGRNRGISCIYISPAPAKVHNSILGSCSHIFSYKMTLQTQIEWLRDNFYGNEAWLLLSKDLRNRYYTGENDPDQLPKFSYLYRKDTDMKTQIMIPDLGNYLTKPDEIKTEESINNPNEIKNDSEPNPDPQDEPAEIT
jgi:hypothetical protein